MKVDITDNSEEVLDAFHTQLAQALEAIGLMAETNAKMEVSDAVYDSPETWYTRTGNLRNSISHTADDDTAYVGTNTEYAVYVEMGTSRGGEPWVYMGDDGQFHVTKGMPPRPFIKPAVEDHVDEYKEIAETYLKG